AGVIVGAAGGVVAVWLVAREAGLPGGTVITHSVVTGLGLGVISGVWLVATATVFAGSRIRDVETRTRRVRLLDIAAVGAAGAVALGLARGGVGGEGLSAGGDKAL